MIAESVTAAGYLHPRYASSLREIGAPRHLPMSDGWILERTIQGSDARDGMGTYPIFCCRAWDALDHDLRDAAGDLVALSLVTDPFGEQDRHRLLTLFPDLVAPFKTHYILDLSADFEAARDPHHRRNERRGLAVVSVEHVVPPDACAQEWAALYSVLVAKHQIRGFAAFSPSTLSAQLQVPGAVVFAGRIDGAIVGIAVWYIQDAVAYYHLAAYTDAGYENRASYALFSRAIQFFAEGGLHWVDLGGVAGAVDDGSTGLARFNRGWSTGSRTVFLCGRIFDRSAYDDLSRRRGVPTGTTYFPAYRAEVLP